MNLIIGIITVVACTMGGYMLEGGHLEVLAKAAPLELVIMGGTAAGGFIIANPIDRHSPHRQIDGAFAQKSQI